MTHTPETWTKEGLAVIAGTRGTICVCPVISLGGVFEVEANARLIAAAPELLALVHEAYSYLDPIDFGDDTVGENLVIKLMDMIVKVEGDA
jgi:hypothetical protein